MSVLYPLRFQGILRRYLWGGRQLAALGKSLGPESDYAESWEVVDRRDDQSLVAYGPLAGQSLGSLVQQQETALLGQHVGGTHVGERRFPLLFKFLDANDRLSIQVHPDDARAALLDPPDLGKTEAWVVLAAEPGSYLYAGLRPGIDRAGLQYSLDRHTVELCFERIEPNVGDCFFLPAGVVHALGPGLLIAEIQQASDTTYRLYDYDRVGPDGKARALHIDQGLAVIDYDYGPVAAQRPQPGTAGSERLVACDKFVLERRTIGGAGKTTSIGGDNRCHLVAVLSGSIDVEGDPAGCPLTRGGVVLLPAEIGAVALQAGAETVLLDAYLP